MYISRTSQNLVVFIAVAVTALIGGVAVMAADRAKAISVTMVPGGDEIQVWNPTLSTWGRCVVVLDDKYSYPADRIPKRTLLMVPRRLFGAPDIWEPARAVVRCDEPRKAEWARRMRAPAF